MQTWARAVDTRIALTTTKKGNLSVTELANEMAAAGKPLGDVELVANILTGLNMEYNPLVSTLLAWVQPVSFGELKAKLLIFKSHLDLRQGGSPSSGYSVQGTWRVQPRRRRTRS